MASSEHATREDAASPRRSRGISLVLLVVSLVVVGGVVLLGRGLATNSEANRAEQANLTLDERMLGIADQLQCLVCEGESIAYSNSRLATEMRRTITEKLETGESEAQIKAYFVDRYGIRILREPPRTGLNAWLWFVPVIGFALASVWLVWMIWRMARRRAAEQADETAARTSNDADDPELDDSVRDMLAQYDKELFAR